jgi:hypothetical protein
MLNLVWNTCGQNDGDGDDERNPMQTSDWSSCIKLEARSRIGYQMTYRVIQFCCGGLHEIWCQKQASKAPNNNSAEIYQIRRWMCVVHVASSTFLPSFKFHDSALGDTESH